MPHLTEDIEKQLSEAQRITCCSCAFVVFVPAGKSPESNLEHLGWSKERRCQVCQRADPYQSSLPLGLELANLASALTAFAGRCSVRALYGAFPADHLSSVAGLARCEPLLTQLELMRADIFRATLAIRRVETLQAKELEAVRRRKLEKGSRP